MAVPASLAGPAPVPVAVPAPLSHHQVCACVMLFPTCCGGASWYAWRSYTCCCGKRCPFFFVFRGGSAIPLPFAAPAHAVVLSAAHFLPAAVARCPAVRSSYASCCGKRWQFFNDFLLTVFHLVVQDGSVVIRDGGDGSEGYPLDNGGSPVLPAPAPVPASVPAPMSHHQVRP